MPFRALQLLDDGFSRWRGGLFLSNSANCVALRLLRSLGEFVGHLTQSYLRALVIDVVENVGQGAVEFLVHVCGGW